MFYKTVLFLLLTFLSVCSFAGKLTCQPSTDMVNLGNFKSGQIANGTLIEFQCLVNTSIPYGSAITYQRTSFGTEEKNVTPLMYPATLPPISEAGSGTYTYCYRDQTCTYRALSKGQRFSLKLYYANNTFGAKPGQYVGQMTLYQTPLRSQGPTEQVVTFNYYYNIDALPCNLSSKAYELALNNLDNRLQDNPYGTASIILNCPSASEISVRLAPSDGQIVNSAQGISSTSLSGLNMQVKWNNLEAISFNSNYVKKLNTGQNNLEIRFYPKLATATAQPAGSFRSNYTLTLDYK